MYRIRSFIKNTIVAFLLIFSVLCLTSCKAAAVTLKKSSTAKNVVLTPLSDYNQSKKLVAREYILGPNDVISLEVFGIPEFSKEIRIQPDGKISIPFLDNFDVAGMSIGSLQEVVKTTYNEYLQDPKVNLKLVQSRPFIVYVSGAVVNPGSYEMNTMTNQSSYLSKPEAFIERKTPLLSNILVAAGGIDYDADIEHVIITNDFDKSSFEINLFELINNANSSQDIYLTAGDRIYIPTLPSATAIDLEKYKVLVTSTIFQKSIPIKVMGYVNTPGLVNLSSQQSANLSSAIAAAGGYLKDSAYFPKKVLISRADNNNKLITVAIDPRENEFILMPNDIVYVPEKFKPSMGKMFDYITRMVYPFYVFSNAYNNWDEIIK